MTIRHRALVFSTFFGSCIAIGLLLVSLTTNQWVRAYPRRANSTNSKGEVNYGLFYGSAELDPGFGLRYHPVMIYSFINEEPGTMNFWLWLITALGTGLGLLSSAIAAVASVLKAASAGKKRGTMVLLFATNISSASTQVIAFVCWLVQFYQYLQNNVLAVEHTNNKWYSNGLAHLGYSFYLVIASILVVLINIVILLYVRRSEQRYRRRFQPPSEEKNQRAIMLY